MAKQLEGRVRYDGDTDSFVYEVLSDGEWGMSMKAECVRREGADDGEETNYIHYELLKKIVHDVEVYGVKLHLE